MFGCVTGSVGQKTEGGIERLRSSDLREPLRWSVSNRDPLLPSVTIPQGVRNCVRWMGSKTHKLSTVGDRIILEKSMHIPVFHPFGHDAEVELFINHLNTRDRQDVVILDLFGNQHLLTEPLEVT